MNITDFLIVSLAVWRLSSLLSREDGPYQVLAKLRELMGVRFDEASRPYGLNEFARAIICIWCLSVWVGLVAAIAYVVLPRLTVAVAIPLALSTVVIVVDGLLDR